MHAKELVCLRRTVIVARGFFAMGQGERPLFVHLLASVLLWRSRSQRSLPGLWSPAQAGLFLFIEWQTAQANSRALATFYYHFHLELKSLSSNSGFQNGVSSLAWLRVDAR